VSDPNYQRTTAASRKAAQSVRYIHRSVMYGLGKTYWTGATARKVRIWDAKQVAKKARRAAKVYS
jgi:hypothetical protein